MVGRMYLAVVLSIGVDWLVLMCVNRMNGQSAGSLRAVFGALLGGVYTWLCTMPGFPFLGCMFWRLTVLLVVGLVAYDLSIKKTVQFLLLEMALYGMTAGSGNAGVQNIILVLIILVVLYIISFRGKIGPQSVAVRVFDAGGSVDFFALCDSGNLLIDHITGQSVLIVSSDLSQRLIGIPADDLRDPVACMKQGSGLRLIPYHTVGSSGLLVAKRFEKVSVDGSVKPRIVAFSPNQIGAGKHFCALTGGN